MARKLGTFMFCIRLSQLLAWLIIALENGWLTEYILHRKLGFTNKMAAIEWIAGFGAAYTLLIIWLLHKRHRCSSPCYLVVFIIGDFHLVGVALATMTILSVAGVPDNCQLLTRRNYDSNDTPNNPAPGFTTIRFGSGPDNRGELDNYCLFPRIAWGLCIAQIYVYIATITLALLRIRNVKSTHLDLEIKATPSPQSRTTSTTSLAAIPTPSTSSALPHLTQVVTPRHELATAHNTIELPSPTSELSSPISPLPAFVFHTTSTQRDDSTAEFLQASISNGTRGVRASGSMRSASIRSGPPPYMPASEGALSRVMVLGEKEEGRVSE